MPTQPEDDLPWILAHDALEHPGAARELLAEFVSQYRQTSLTGNIVVSDGYIAFVACAIERYLAGAKFEQAAGLTKRGRPASRNPSEEWEIWRRFRFARASGLKYEANVTAIAEDTGRSLENIKRLISEVEGQISDSSNPVDSSDTTAFERIQMLFGYRPRNST